MKRAYLIACVVLLILLISPVTTWAGSCPEGQKWDDRKGNCVKDRTSSSKKKSVPLKKLSEVEFSISGHPIDFKARRARFLDLASKGTNNRWYCSIRINYPAPVKLRDRNLLLAEVRDCTISGPRNPVVVCFTSLLSSLTAISSPHPFCFLSTTHNLP